MTVRKRKEVEMKMDYVNGIIKRATREDAETEIERDAAKREKQLNELR